MTCQSAIHPDGCPPVYLSAGHCHCDCHNLTAECQLCGDENHRDDLELWVFPDGPSWLCADCITPLEAQRKANP